MRIKTALSLAFLVLLATPAVAQDEAKNTIKQLSKAAEVAFQDKNWDGVIEATEAIVEQNEKDGRAWYMLGFALHAKGELDKALKAHIMAAPFPEIGATAAYNAACVYALRGDTEQAFEWLGKAVKSGFSGAGHMATDPDLASLRDDARYKKIIEAIGSAPRKSFQAFVNTSKRDSARLSFWDQTGSLGQVVIDYGPVEWKEAYAGKIESPEFNNLRWRLGNNFWTNLDSNIDLTIGDAKIPAGQYYLTVERKDDGVYTMAFLEPAKVRAKKLDAYMAQYTKGGIEVAMQHKVTDSLAERLKMEIGVGKEDNTKGKLVIHFGPHVLVAPVTVHL